MLARGKVAERTSLMTEGDEPPTSRTRVGKKSPAVESRHSLWLLQQFWNLLPMKLWLAWEKLYVPMLGLMNQLNSESSSTESCVSSRMSAPLKQPTTYLETCQIYKRGWVWNLSG